MGRGALPADLNTGVETIFAAGSTALSLSGIGTVAGVALFFAGLGLTWINGETWNLEFETMQNNWDLDKSQCKNTSPPGSGKRRRLASRHLVQGVGESQFEPDRGITRAEVANLLVAMLAADPARNVKVEASVTPTFTDVAPGAWYYAYVETAARLGIIRGSAGRFRPGDRVTRQEMAVMIQRAMGKEAAARALDRGHPGPGRRHAQPFGGYLSSTFYCFWDSPLVVVDPHR